MSLFSPGEIDPLLSLRLQLERQIRKQLSEHVIHQIHDGIWSPINAELRSVKNSIETSLQDALGTRHELSPKELLRRSISRLRNLLERNAKERDLQNELINSGLMELNCKIIQEVSMAPTEDYTGMRMDILVTPNDDRPTAIVELKRGSHALVARRGKPTHHISRSLLKAISQVQSYGERLQSDIEAIERIEDGYGIRVENPELRLVAGRRLSDEHEYTLLTAAESAASADGLELQIYTWDGLLSELERIVN